MTIATIRFSLLNAVASLLPLVAPALVAPAASATVCNFDDLPALPSTQAGLVPSGYCGATWTWPLGNPAEYFSNGFSYTGGLGQITITPHAHSAPNALWLGGNGGASFSFATAVTLNYFWATAASVSTACASPSLQYSLSFSDGTGFTSGVIAISGSVQIPGSNKPVVAVGIFNSASACGFGGISIDDVTYNTTPTCTNFTVSPTSQQNFPISGGAGTYTVNGDAGCSFTAISGASWIQITDANAPNYAIPSPAQAVSVHYSVQANSGIGFRDGTLTIAGQSRTIQEAGPVQFQATGTRADLSMGTQNVLAGKSAGFSGSGWPVDGGSITVTFSNPVLQTQTFSPPAFSGSLLDASGPVGLKFPSQSSPPCTLQVTATQGSITQTVTLAGIYLAKVVLTDANGTGFHVGNQICQFSSTIASAADFINSEAAIITSGDFAIEAADTGQGGSTFYVLDPGVPEIALRGGVLINPGRTFSFPTVQGVATLLADATSPIPSSVLSAPPSACESCFTPSPVYVGTFLISSQTYVDLPRTLLDNAFLHFTGDATFTAGVGGVGSIISPGNISIAGGVNMTAQDSPGNVLIAAGNITIRSGSSCALLAAIRAAMGAQCCQSPPDPAYNSALDLNGDGRIDVKDLAIAGRQLTSGTVCQ